MNKVFLFLLCPSLGKTNNNIQIKLFNVKNINGIIALIIAIGTAMIGYTIHHSIAWAIVDFFFWPLAWIKWLICQEVNMTIIRTTFEFLSK